MNDKQESHGNDGKHGNDESHNSHASHKSHPDQNQRPIIPPRGDYQTLLSYQKAEVVYDITFRFAHKFLFKGDRTVDQVIQSARSGKQNILEGSKAATTSKETEIKQSKFYVRCRGLQQSGVTDKDRWRSAGLGRSASCREFRSFESGPRLRCLRRTRTP